MNRRAGARARASRPARSASRLTAPASARCTGGPFDAHGRSLKTLDLETRLLAHPCSHLIHTASFDGLPDELRSRFWERLDAALAEPDGDPASRLSARDRRAIREILAATKSGAPVRWAVP